MISGATRYSDGEGVMSLSFRHYLYRCPFRRRMDGYIYMIEKELKIMLTADDYDRVESLLLSRYKTMQSFIQINYYYDSDDFTNIHSGNTLRIRQIDNLSLEYKCRKISKDGIRESLEYRKEILHLPKEILLSEAFALNDNTVYTYLGQLTTQRTNFVRDNSIISLDKNLYLGIADYELEIESESVDEIRRVEKSLDLGLPTNAAGKYSRFYQQLQRWHGNLTTLSAHD